MVGLPLEGLRVLDLTRFVAGSQATLLLAAMGAEVVKVEVPPGDPYRWQGTEKINGESALFLALNSGKRSLALDFRKPAGRDALEGVLASADMLVENSRPGSLSSHGLDWESVHARYPSLIYGSISGYGDVGPDAAKGGFDLILQAESGMMSVTGAPSSGPVKVGAPVLDVGAGLTCALGLLAACVERQRTGVAGLSRHRCWSSRSPAWARWPQVCWLRVRRQACWGRTRPCLRRTAGSGPLMAGWCWPARARKTCGAARAACSGWTTL